MPVAYDMNVMATSSGGAKSEVVDLEERMLLVRHRNGEQEAFRELVSRYRAPTYGYLVRCGVSPLDRDDLFQEIFIKVHRAAASYQPERPLHPWLFTIVANTVRTYHRKRRVHELVFNERLPEPVAAAPDSLRATEAKETVDWLEREIPTLPAMQREVLLLVCVEGMRLALVADALDIPLNTVKTHLRRARMKLTGKLALRYEEKTA